MPHIALPPRKPGMIALAAYRPDVYSHLGALADLLLHQEHPNSTLSLGERELIATRISFLNSCKYCHTAHGNIAAAHLHSSALVDDVKAQDLEDSEGLSSKMKELLRIAGLVQKGGKEVSAESV